jgi:hypothetical protein
MRRRPVRQMDSSPADHRASIHVKRLQTYINLPTKQVAKLSLMFSDSRVGPHRRLRAARVLGAVGAGSALGQLLPALRRSRAASRYLRGLRPSALTEKSKRAAWRGWMPGARTRVGCHGWSCRTARLQHRSRQRDRQLTQRVYLAGRIVPWMCRCLRSHESGVCWRNRHRRA